MDTTPVPDVAAVYDDLRAIAAFLLRREQSGVAFQPTSLVNEAVLRLLGADFSHKDREHLVRTVRKKMREILIDRARYYQSAKHGGDRKREPLDEVIEDLVARQLDPTGVYEALKI